MNEVERLREEAINRQDAEAKLKPYCMATLAYTYEKDEPGISRLVPHVRTWHNHLTAIEARRINLDPEVIADQTRTIVFPHESELCKNGPTEANFPVKIRFESPSAFYHGKFGEGGWGYEDWDGG